jgi:predicted Zn-dependent peptidase
MKRLGLAETTLPSGLRLIHLQTGPSCLFEATAHFPFGSRNEQPQQSGMTHLLEHMMFRGSGPYPTSTAFAKRLEAICGENNAYTSAEMTEFWFQCDVQRHEECLELLRYFLAEPLFDSFDLEKRIITKELDEDYNEAGLLIDVHSLAMNAHFGEQGLGLPVGGTAAGLANISLSDLKSHRNSWYQPHRAIVALRSSLDHDLVFQACTRLLGFWQPAGPKQQPPSAQAQAAARPFARRPGHHPVAVEHSDNQYALRLSFAVPYTSREHMSALELASRILDDGMSSRLQRTVREEKGLVYDVSAFIEEYSDTVICTVDATVDSEHLEETAATICHELKDLARQGPQPGERDHALDRARFELAKLHEQHHEFLERYVEGQFFGRPFDLERDDRLLQETTCSGIQGALASLFQMDHLVTVLVGPDAEQRIGNLTTL